MGCNPPVMTRSIMKIAEVCVQVWPCPHERCRSENIIFNSCSDTADESRPFDRHCLGTDYGDFSQARLTVCLTGYDVPACTMAGGILPNYCGDTENLMQAFEEGCSRDGNPYGTLRGQRCAEKCGGSYRLPSQRYFVGVFA